MRGYSRVFFAVLALAFVAGTAFLPIEIPLSIDAPGHITARREWSLLHGEDGRLVTTLRDNREHTIEDVAVSVYDRGDRVRVSLHPSIRNCAHVHAGDTIACIRSEDAVARSTELRGVHAVERAELAVYESGDKEAAVRAARAEVERATMQVEYQRRQTERVRSLAERGMMSASELDESVNLLRAAEVEQERATAELASVESGAKEQEIAWHRARVRAAAEDAQVAARRLADSVVVAPFSGCVTASAGSTSLLTVRSTEGAVVYFPIPWTRRGELSSGQEVHLTIDGIPSDVHARIYRVGEVALVANGQQYVEVTATIDSTDGIIPGLYARCSVPTGQATPLEWLAHELSLR